MNKVIVKLDGGHSILVQGLSVGEIEDYVVDMREQEYDFLYLQPPNLAPNSIAIDPKRVVAIIQAGVRE